MFSKEMPTLQWMTSYRILVYAYVLTCNSMRAGDEKLHYSTNSGLIWENGFDSIYHKLNTCYTCSSIIKAMRTLLEKVFVCESF